MIISKKYQKNSLFGTDSYFALNPRPEYIPFELKTTCIYLLEDVSSTGTDFVTHNVVIINGPTSWLSYTVKLS